MHATGQISKWRAVKSGHKKLTKSDCHPIHHFCDIKHITYHGQWRQMGTRHTMRVGSGQHDRMQVSCEQNVQMQRCFLTHTKVFFFSKATQHSTRSCVNSQLSRQHQSNTTTTTALKQHNNNNNNNIHSNQHTTKKFKSMAQIWIFILMTVKFTSQNHISSSSSSHQYMTVYTTQYIYMECVHSWPSNDTKITKNRYVLDTLHSNKTNWKKMKKCNESPFSQWSQRSICWTKTWWKSPLYSTKKRHKVILTLGP